MKGTLPFRPFVVFLQKITEIVLTVLDDWWTGGAGEGPLSVQVAPGD